MAFNKALLIHHNHAGKANRADAVGTAAGVLAPAVRELVVVRTDEPGEGKPCAGIAGKSSMSFYFGWGRYGA